jgi:predicted dehydrogenase
MNHKNHIRLAIIGCGRIAVDYHIPAIKQFVPEMQIEVVVDNDQSWVKEVARRFKIPVFLSDYKQVVGHADAALVATPNASHAEISAFLLEHGIHVICEKPLATTVKDAELLFDIAHKNNTRLLVNQSRRFQNNIFAVNKLVQLGTIGNVKSLKAGLGGPIEKWGSRTPYRANRAQAGGGTLMDSGVHLIDLVVWIMGESPINVDCQAEVDRELGIETDAVVRLGYQNGAECDLVTSYTHGVDGSLKVVGDMGWIKTTMNYGEVEFFNHQAMISKKDGIQKIITPNNNAYGSMFRHFVDGIYNHSDFLVRPDEAIATLRVLEKCYDQIGVK